MTDRSLLLVHAHPDDEAIPTGVTIAKYAAEGVRVTLVTCTLGEAGEILADDLKHLDPDGLGRHRLTELRDAAEHLGISDVRVLGGPGRWRDSGMIGTPENDDPRCFWRADLAEATAVLAAIVREVRPQVVVTYDENGSYGHPDHIQAHRVTVAAVDAAAEPSYPAEGAPWQVSKLYYTALPKSVLASAIELFKDSGDSFFAGVESVDDLPFGTDDELVTTKVDAREHLDRKQAAMLAHRSQITKDSFFFAVPEESAADSFGVEWFTLVRGTVSGPTDEHGRETDLFAGI